jgi:hypothetical protein
MDMEIAKARALRKHAEETLDELAIVCQLLRASASDKNVEITVDIILAILKDGFLAGWNAAIDYCMQPVEKEVPAEAATSDEHTNNTCEPILSGREDEVNACDCN